MTQSFLIFNFKFLISSKFLIFIFLTFLNSNIAWSAVIDEDAILEKDKEINQRLEQQRLDDIRSREIQETEKIRKSRKFEEDKALTDKELTSKDKDICIPLDNIIFKGNTIYSSNKLRNKFLKKHLELNNNTNNKTTEDTKNKKRNKENAKCITKSKLNTIQSEITNYYISKGYTNARVYFDTRSLNTPERTLIIFIAEGQIKEIKLKNNSKVDENLPFRKTTKTFTAFPLMSNKPFNLRDFEQGLDQMNRLQSNNAKMESRPDIQDGYSDIIITNTISNPTSINLSYDNSGQESTGKYKQKISLSQDNLLALNDNIYINYARNASGNEDERYSKSLYSSLSIPLGYWTFTGSYSKSRYRTTILQLNSPIRTEGITSTETYKIDRVITRGKRYKTKLGTELTRKDTRTYIAGDLSETGSRKLTIGNIFLDNTLYTKMGTFFIKPSYTEGLNILDAKTDEDRTLKTDPHAQYEVAKLYGYYNTNINLPVGFVSQETPQSANADSPPLPGRRELIYLPFNYMLTLDSQYSWDHLYGSEQMSLGGEYSIRGFDENNISGDSGYNVRNDVKINIRDLFNLAFNNQQIDNGQRTIDNYGFGSALLTKFISKTTLKLFYDYGYVRKKYIANNDYAAEGYMSGAGTGLEYNGKYLDWSLTYSKGLHSPKYIQNVYGNAKDEETIYFSISVGI